MSSPSPLSQTTCDSLLKQLQEMWDEIGESESDRDRMLRQLEQDCLDIYKRKIENSKKYKTELRQALSDAETEVNNLVAAIGEPSSFTKVKGSLKERIAAVQPILEELRSKKQERVKAFSEIQSQIAHICAEISGSIHSDNSGDVLVNEIDLTVKKLGDLRSHLRELQEEKMLRLQKIDSHLQAIHGLVLVMSIDFTKTVNGVHPSLSGNGPSQAKSISNETLAKLAGVIQSLKQEKLQRLRKLQVLGISLRDLWSLLDSSTEEKERFNHVTRLTSSSIDDVSSQGCLGLDVIEQSEIEVARLKSLKTSKLKELVMKRQNELEEIYSVVHMDIDRDAARQFLINQIESGNVDLSDLLSHMDNQVAIAREEAQKRRDVLDKVERWKHALEEETWLDDYERDENRYSAGKGAHKNLKRAEKARVLVNKIPSMVESLIGKVKAWEEEKGITFLYYKAPLLKTLEDYTIQRQAREEEKRRARENKRLQEQLNTEKEAMFGSRPKKPLGQSTNNNNTTNYNNMLVGTPNGRRGVTPSARKEGRESSRVGGITPVNYVALAKDDSSSASRP